MLGDIYLKNKVPPSVDRKYFWRDYHKISNEVKFFVEVCKAIRHTVKILLVDIICGHYLKVFP